MGIDHISLLTLRIAHAVATHGSIARAAGEMHIAISAASKRIRDLECDLGAVLFHRQRTGLAVTDAGKVVLDHARSLFTTLERMQADLAEFSIGLQGDVRIAANSSSLLEFLPEDLAGFARRFPNVRVLLQEQKTADVQRSVRDGLADIGIFAGEAAPNLQSFPYRRDQLVLVVCNDHPFVGRQEIEFGDTLQFDHVGMGVGTSLHRLITTMVARQGRSLNLVALVSSFEALRCLIANGIGVGVMPEACIAPYAQLMGLAWVRLADSWAMRQLNLCIRAAGDLPKAARLVADHLLEGDGRPDARNMLSWSGERRLAGGGAAD